MLIVLTGGAGLIGTALVQKLRAGGHRVNLLVRSPKKVRKEISRNCGIFLWNALSGPPPKEAFPKTKEPWGAVHLSGENVFRWPWTKAVKKNLYQSRVTGTKNLVQTLSRLPFPPDFFISASAVGIYGTNESAEESSALEEKGSGKLFLQKICRDWEKEALQAGAFSRTTVFRLGYVLSARGGFLKKQLSLINRKIYGFLKTDRPFWISWIHEEDVTELFLWAVRQSAVKGIYNAVSPAPVTLKDFSTELCRRLNFKPLAPPVPLSFLKFLGGEAAKNLFISYKVFPKRAESQGYVFRHPEIKEALSALLKNH